MTSRLVLTRKDPRKTDFVLVDNANASHTSRAGTGPLYTSDTTHYARPRNGTRATTTITRADPAGSGDRLQVGVIEWPVDVQSPVQLVVGTRAVPMSRLSTFTSSERFTATDGLLYEWQVHDARPQLVPLRGYTRISTSYIATFVQSRSGFCFRRKLMSSLFIPPEGFHILDDIIVTFIYFESKWREKEGAKARTSLSGGVL